LVFLYNIFIQLYKIAIEIAAIGNKKASAWIQGRKNLFENLIRQIDNQNSYIWIHSASAGEFEQAKPVIDGLKTKYPDHKILVTFFSPSGYEAGKKFKKADIISYLPLDTAKNAKNFIQLVKPKLVVFVKYDYWYHHLKMISKNQIPLILISTIFREEQPFFKFYGSLHKKMLHFFTRIFVQDSRSLDLLKRINISHASISGDTRFDRVNDITKQQLSLPLIDQFINNKKTIVAGSTWPEDEQLLSEIMRDNNHDFKLILAPHEITSHHIKSILSNFTNALKYSQANEKDVSSYSTLIIDSVGILSQLYKYGTITYIGGGFNKSGIHNTLEAAVWGKPVLFGPNYQKFKEARDLINLNAACSVSTPSDLKNEIISLMENENKLTETGKAASDYIQSNKGATNVIIDYIQENRLLTN
jgi:3-deoxy-D-manno-octulosonic-acid transferase